MTPITQKQLVSESRKGRESQRKAREKDRDKDKKGVTE